MFARVSRCAVQNLGVKAVIWGCGDLGRSRRDTYLLDHGERGCERRQRREGKKLNEEGLQPRRSDLGKCTGSSRKVEAQSY